MTTGRQSARPRLRDYRERRGLTQQQVADELMRLAWLRHGKRVGVNADMVSKWERGDKRPSPLYRDLFCMLFRAAPTELGLTRTPPETLPDRLYSATSEADDALSGAVAVLDELGDAGVLIQPHMLAIVKDELMNRRSMLKLLGAAPFAALLPGDDRFTGTSVGARTAVSAAVVAQAESLALHYQQLYHSVDPASLIRPVAAHLRAVSEMLSTVRAEPLRRRLLENYAQVALLAGRLTFFDLRDPMAARAYLNLALEAAQEARNGALAAGALGHASFLAAADQRYAAATSYLQGANRHAAGMPLLQSWLSAVEAEIQTNAGAVNPALVAVERAHALLGESLGERVHAWFDFYDEARLAGFAGFTYMCAGRADDAEAALREAAARLPADALKQRSIVLIDLATVQARRREVDEATRLALEAADALAQAGYATGTERLLGFRSQLRPWQDHPGVRLLDERLVS